MSRTSKESTSCLWELWWLWWLHICWCRLQLIWWMLNHPSINNKITLCPISFLYQLFSWIFSHQIMSSLAISAIHSSTFSFQSISNHPQYYLPGGDLYTITKAIWFCIHKYFFEQESVHFQTIFEITQKFLVYAHQWPPLSQRNISIIPLKWPPLLTKEYTYPTHISGCPSHKEIYPSYHSSSCLSHKGIYLSHT